MNGFPSGHVIWMLSIDSSLSHNICVRSSDLLLAWKRSRSRIPEALWRPSQTLNPREHVLGRSAALRLRGLCTSRRRGSPWSMSSLAVVLTFDRTERTETRVPRILCDQPPHTLRDLIAHLGTSRSPKVPAVHTMHEVATLASAGRHRQSLALWIVHGFASILESSSATPRSRLVADPRHRTRGPVSGGERR